MEYRLGLVSISFRGNTPEEILSAMRAAGLSHIEWGSDVHAPYTDRARLSELAALQRAYGITCSSYGTYFKFGQAPVSELNGYIDGALALGTDLLRIWAGTKSPAAMTASEREVLFRDCAEAAEIAERRGVTLALECHRNTYTEEKEAALSLMRGIDSRHFRMYWQPAQWRSARENLDYARALAPYTERLHVFHWDADRRFPLADGIEAWKAYLRQFPENAYLLLEFMPDDLLSSLAREAEALRKIIA